VVVGRVVAPVSAKVDVWEGKAGDGLEGGWGPSVPQNLAGAAPRAKIRRWAPLLVSDESSQPEARHARQPSGALERFYILRLNHCQCHCFGAMERRKSQGASGGDERSRSRDADDGHSSSSKRHANAAAGYAIGAGAGIVASPSELLADIAAITALTGYAAEASSCVPVCRDTWRDKRLSTAVVNVTYGPAARTRLHYAAAHGHADRVSELLSSGADVNAFTFLNWGEGFDNDGFEW
jgi:hypothetical protein